MPSLKPLQPIALPRSPEDYLRLAMTAPDAERRSRFALDGLAAAGDEGIDVDTHAMLLRQLYRGLLDAQNFARAADVAKQMASLGVLEDVAHHDASRALAALGRNDEAIDEQRLAARAAPADRRSFHLWSLATLQHFQGDVEGALASLRRGLRWSRRDKPLLQAHYAYIKLDAGKGVSQLAEVVHDLSHSPSREGYGQFLLGMLLHHMGDERRAAVHLRAFLRRNASAEPAKVATLQEEFRRAREVLARGHHVD